MSPSERGMYKQVARSTGDDAVNVVAKSDGPARRAITDGGRDVDFREGIARAADSDAIDSFDQIDDAVKKINNLDGDASLRAQELIADTDGAGVKLVDELGDDALQRVLDDTDVGTGDLSRATRKYGDLNSAKRSQFRELLADDDLRASWVRSVGAESTDITATRTALRRADELDDAHTVNEFESSKQANDRFIRNNRGRLDDPVGPHRDGGIVIKYETDGTQNVYRLWDQDHPDSNMFGEFTTTEDVATSADSFADLTEDLAAPAKFEYDSIARVEVPEGTSIEYSTVGRNYGRSGGAAQTRLVDRVPEDNWTPLESLSDVGS